MYQLSRSQLEYDSQIILHISRLISLPIFFIGEVLRKAKGDGWREEDLHCAEEDHFQQGILKIFLHGKRQH